MLPDCCRRIKVDLLSVWGGLADREGIPYQINMGSLLGAVKFKGPLPWDFDDDVIFRNEDVDKVKKHNWYLRRRGLSAGSPLEIKRNGSLNMYVFLRGQGEFALDLWGVQNYSATVTEETLNSLPGHISFLDFHSKPIKIAEIIKKHKDEEQYLKQSLVLLGDEWFPAPWNPGKVVREKYGPNHLQHEPHWRLKEGEGWSRCPIVGHPTCLDLHPLDGSIPFLWGLGFK